MISIMVHPGDNVEYRKFREKMTSFKGGEEYNKI